ncbi:hypothetical protein PFICI_09895 [Pestalotiopsis fici W106-1]|uniref:Uncharacterized protein n=1 Tax=Pestalotiopsis fici (strain W106-1 / CGMCC3.15140) TaxID=1229662 RepID=W3WVD6_PESFW|nr:uncharacterized protein PFICI_09895 [Pestalotiopsis fici W106-1]ETS77833.1 hypothetical protein PFICI_09895 [Pestalotiopsis fici W106-1]
MQNENAPSWLFTDPYAYQYSDLSNYAPGAERNGIVSERNAGTAELDAGPHTAPQIRRPSYREPQMSRKGAMPARDAAQAPEVYVAPVSHERWSSLEPVMPNDRYHHMRALDLCEKIPYVPETSRQHSKLEVVSPAGLNKSKSATSFDDILQSVEYEKSKLSFKTWEIERARGRRAKARFDAGH